MAENESPGVKAHNKAHPPPHLPDIGTPAYSDLLAERKHNPPAFPFVANTGAHAMFHTGMTLRDYFAKGAMEAIMANENLEAVEFLKKERDSLGYSGPDFVAAMAYQQAAAMLKAREAGEGEA